MTDGFSVPEPEGLPEQFSVDLESLDAAFTLPEWIEDPALRHVYEVLVVKFRREAAHVQASTAMETLIERICFTYIVMKTMDHVRPGETGGYANSSSRKDFYSFYLELLKQFEKMTNAASSVQLAQVGEKIYQALQNAIRASNLPQETRKQLQSNLKLEIERVGL